MVALANLFGASDFATLATPRDFPSEAFATFATEKKERE
jgi:hypothetical protein